MNQQLADVVAVDFEPECDDLMDEGETPPQPKLKSAITGSGEGGPPSASKKTKGRRLRDETKVERSNRFSSKNFDSLDSEGGPGAQR
ncbi:hypothetical protein MKW94_000362, partial [Papaver nudicaule]|nr:hypothetical protein [Papaver nudicaule]